MKGSALWSSSNYNELFIIVKYNNSNRSVGLSLLLLLYILLL
jgi:hypothetical protein